MPTPFRCPECARTSWHPADVVNGWCGACRDVTGLAQRVYDDDAHQGAVMRLHVHQRRVADLSETWRRTELQMHARNRGIPDGGTKAALAARIVDAGFTAGDIRRHVYVSRHERSTT